MSKTTKEISLGDIGARSEELGAERMQLNLGPSHPATHGVLRGASRRLRERAQDGAARAHPRPRRRWAEGESPEKRREEEARKREEEARLAAMHAAEVEKARLDAENAARLEQMKASQHHEREKLAISQDEEKKKLKRLPKKRKSKKRKL